MPDYSFVIDSMAFSHSSVTSFETCPLSFKLQYIDAEKREQNFYGEYGSFVHSVIEKHFKKELERDWLKDYFIDNYSSAMKADPPSFPEGIVDKYYQDAINFFENTELLNRELYEVVANEEALSTEWDGINLVVKPDLILKELSTNQIILWDAKSSAPYKNGKWDLKKIAGYEKQMILYAYTWELVKKQHIDKIQLLFIRLDKMYDVEVTPEKTKDVLNWFSNGVQSIRWEEDFEPKVNKFFCSQICGVRNSCHHWQGD